MAKAKQSTTAVPDIDELPPTMPIPECGALFFGASGPASYRLARSGVIPTVETGSRNKRALPRVLARRLGVDPNNPK
jgi:hypothetical protein